MCFSFIFGEFERIPFFYTMELTQNNQAGMMIVIIALQITCLILIIITNALQKKTPKEPQTRLQKLLSNQPKGKKITNTFKSPKNSKGIQGRDSSVGRRNDHV